MIYCKIVDGAVVNRALFDDEMPEDWPDREKWVRNDDAQIGWLVEGSDLVPPSPLEEPEPEPQPFRLYKSAFIRRLTSGEAEIMESVLAGADAKLRLMFNSVEYFVSDDPLFETLKGAVGVALGVARAEELLSPDQ